MGRCLLWGLLAVCPLWAQAEKMPSIMFGNEDTPVLQQDTARDEAWRAHCRDLSVQIDDAKGKPLRRSALVERYNAECTGADADVGTIFDPGPSGVLR